MAAAPDSRVRGIVKEKRQKPGDKDRIGRPILTRLDTVQPEAMQWLWPGRVPLGKLTLLAGDPGLGKSLVTLDMAARISQGAGWPDGPEILTPGGVVLLSAEDDVADTIRPRLDAASADVARIALLQGVEWLDGQAKQARRSFSLERDLPALEEAVAATPNCRLVVIDPISAYCGTADSHKNADIRGLLGPLAELAQRARVATVAVTHLNKGADKAMYRAMGSLAFVAAARAAWAVVQDQEDPARRLMLPIKSNLAQKMTGLSYTVVENGGAPCLAWSPEPISLGVDDVLTAEDGPRDRERQDAKRFLQELLAAGPVEQKQVKKEASEGGLAWRTVRRAKVALEVEAFREGYGKEGCWFWCLPGQRGPGNPNDGHIPDVDTFGEDGHLWTPDGVEGGPDGDPLG
jgi:archaellum biogenesis ATPase FlaH